MEASTMTQAGTMELGGNARAKQGGGRWPLVVWTLIVVVATIAAVWFASSAGLVGGTSAKPAADRSYDAIEAQRGAITLSSDRNAYLNDILDRAHAAPYAGTAVTLSDERSQYLNGILDRAHATPYVGVAVQANTAPHISATSGTFLPGEEADQLMTQFKRDRVGGP
jgi:hypothetical protein